jgi:hypothetical protein
VTRGAASIGYMHHVQANHHFEQLTAYVLRGADAGRSIVELARVCFRIGDEFRDGLRRDRGVPLLQETARYLRPRLRQVAPLKRLEPCLAPAVSVQAPNSSLSARPVVALAWVMARFAGASR